MEDNPLLVLFTFLWAFALGAWIVMLSVGNIGFHISYLQTVALMLSLRILFVFTKGEFK